MKIWMMKINIVDLFKVKQTVMKKLVGISIVFLSVAISACQKEVIRPTSTTPSTSSEVLKMSRTSETTGEKTTNSGTTESGAGITDPNNDPDLSIKKVVKLKP